MSLTKKIVLSFLISSAIIAVLAVSAYLNFIEIRSEIRYLEFSDTLRSKTLQLRRHEKNFLLYGDLKEIESVHAYLSEIRGILGREVPRYRTDTLRGLQEKVEDYSQLFNRIETSFWDFHNEFSKLRMSSPKYGILFPLIESTFMERPLANAELLGKLLRLSADNPLISNLRGLHTDIQDLRKNGEEILTLSKDLDKSAREKADRNLYASQVATLVLFPIFLIVGLGTSTAIIHGVVRRLKILSAEVEKAGGGVFSKMTVEQKRWSMDDEVGVLIRKFNTMEDQLARREKELLQSKKLAAIGTLASGVAHELNNPLNNIYTTAQRLMKKTGGDCPPLIRKGLDDIFGQSMRVKRIVGDLLEFARGREPQYREVELKGIIREAFRLVGNTIDTKDVEFRPSADQPAVLAEADPEQLEQVFLNLFTNAVEAMSGKGILTVMSSVSDGIVEIEVSDTGAGIPRDKLDMVFEPFFTTKEKGTGLGLAIVFSIIQKHGGEISAVSEEGKGTSFIIRLPVKRQFIDSGA